MSVERIQSLILDVPDFPKPGIVFKDITPLLADPDGFKSTIDHLAGHVAAARADAILAIESRGFIFGGALAERTAMPLQIVRKLGKLPRETVSIEYELEYGSDHVELHSDAVEAGKRYVILDDLIATGGTAAATAELVQRQGGVVATALFVVELGFLNGRERLGDCEVVSLVRYQD